MIDCGSRRDVRSRGSSVADVILIFSISHGTMTPSAAAAPLRTMAATLIDLLVSKASLEEVQAYVKENPRSVEEERYDPDRYPDQRYGFGLAMLNVAIYYKAPLFGSSWTISLVV